MSPAKEVVENGKIAQHSRRAIDRIGYLAGKLRNPRLFLRSASYKIFSLALRWPSRRLGDVSYLRRLYYLAQPKDAVLCARTECGLFNINTSDLVIGLETYVHRKAYDVEKLKLVCNLLPADHSKELIVDIGANIGTICVSAVASFGFQKAKAFEPESKNYRLLESNVALNGLGSKIALNNLALSDRSTTSLDFELSPINFGDHRVRVSSEFQGSQGEELREVITVPAKCLDDFSQDYSKVDTLIWIDVQGFEGGVLAGASAVIDRRIPMCIEFWPYGLKKSKTFEALLSALADAQYDSIIDLRSPEKRLQFSCDLLLDIAEKLGDEGASTDLLIV